MNNAKSFNYISKLMETKFKKNLIIIMITIIIEHKLLSLS